jgi:hypothetical protein
MAVRDLVAIKVIIKQDPTNGQALYPNFNEITSVTRNGMDWSKFIDVAGGGWHYDKACGHKEESVDSPFGEQIGCLCVPVAFAVEALNLFPGVVSKMTANEFAVFNDDKAHAHEDAEKVDTDTLNGLSARRQLMKVRNKDTTELDKQIDRALNPLIKEEMGVRKNDTKLWADAVGVNGINLIEHK